MLSVSAAFAVGLFVCCTTAGIVGWRDGKSQTLGVGLAVSLLFAYWFEASELGFHLGVSNATAMVLLLAYCVHSRRRLFTPLTILDILIGLIVVWGTFVDVYHGADLSTTPFLFYGEWVVPYVAGRYAVMHRSALAQISHWIVPVGIFISCFVVLESLTKWNLWEWISPQPDHVDYPRYSLRYDLLYRAIGTVRHPIFLSIHLILLIPWSIAMLESASGNARKMTLGIVSLVCLALGIMATLSRGPTLALLLVTVIAFAATTQSSIARWATTIVLVFAIAIAALNANKILDALNTNIANNKATIVELDGEPQLYDSTRNRLVVVQIYWPYVVKGGPMGYGSERTKGFPMRLPNLPAVVQQNRQLQLVDNTYITTGLRLGWIGLALFGLLMLTAIWTAWNMRHSAGTFLYPVGPLTCLSMAVVLMTTAIEISTVYFAYDFGFWVLLMIGVIAGSQSFQSMVRSGEFSG